MGATPFQQLEQTYSHQLHEVLLPFWLRAVDSRHGGVYTCFDNTGSQLISTDKYIWSQGRFAWLMARLARLAAQGVIEGDAGAFLDTARHTAHFLREHALLPDGACAYLLTEDGTPKEIVPGEGYDLSIFADCFVIIGLAETARAAGEPELLALALRTYHNVAARYTAGTYRSEPYPIPRGYRAHSFPMILLNVSQELGAALADAGHPQAQQVREASARYMRQIMREFIGSDHTVVELLTAGSEDSLLARHYNPGHTLESMWFVMTEAQRLADQQVIKMATGACRRAFELGWDNDHGGLFRFVDREGGEPRGRRVGGKLEGLITETWDTKLWWPHSEALFATLLAYALTRDAALLDLYARTHRYTLSTFPNPDPEVGEWIQIRDRQGNPLQKVVALPVKDPFHVLRNVLLILTLLHDHKAWLQHDRAFLAAAERAQA